MGLPSLALTLRADACICYGAGIPGSFTRTRHVVPRCMACGYHGVLCTTMVQRRVDCRKSRPAEFERVDL